MEGKEKGEGGRQGEEREAERKWGGGKRGSGYYNDFSYSKADTPGF